MNAVTQMERVMLGMYKNTAGIIVKRKGKTVYQNYFQGYTENDKVHIASVTKSIVALLIGIAVKQGKLAGIDTKILDFFPEYKVAAGEKTIREVTIKDMLTMTIPYKCKAEPYVKVFTGTQWITTALNLIGGKGRIGEFTYSPMVGIQIISGVFTKATGYSLHEYANKYLFLPLGITVKEDITFQNKEEQLAFLNDRTISGWVMDPEGFQTAGWGLTLNTNDMAKIGQLCLDGGRYQGKEIVPAEWIEAISSKHSFCKEFKLSYGYLWWIIDEKEHAYAAMGDGGNIIYINEKKELVVAITCSFMKGAKDRLTLIKKYIEPAFCSET